MRGGAQEAENDKVETKRTREASGYNTIQRIGAGAGKVDQDYSCERKGGRRENQCGAGR